MIDECVCYLDAAIYNMSLKIEQIDSTLLNISTHDVDKSGASKRLFKGKGTHQESRQEAETYEKVIAEKLHKLRY